MADDSHLQILREGIEAWNDWRKQASPTFVDLGGADLRGAHLVEADLRGANLNGANLATASIRGADLRWAYLRGADLRGARLNGAYLGGAHLKRANFSGAHLGGARLGGADLREANLAGADLFRADLAGADLRGAYLGRANLCEANFTFASLIEANLSNADLTRSRVYGISAWGLKLDEFTKQRDLVVTKENEPEITIDNIEIAQFVYLLLHNARLREVIDTITSKVVLILGRFTDERKAVLEALRNELRKTDYLPILFDFAKPVSRTTDETITLLARMARFVIADISDAKSVLQELRAIVPEVPSVPVQPLIIATQEEPGMFDFYRGRPSFMPVHRYDTPAQLLANLRDRVISPAEAKVAELRALSL